MKVFLAQDRYARQRQWIFLSMNNTTDIVYLPLFHADRGSFKWAKTIDYNPNRHSHNMSESVDIEIFDRDDGNLVLRLP